VGRLDDSDILIRPTAPRAVPASLAITASKITTNKHHDQQ